MNEFRFPRLAGLRAIAITIALLCLTICTPQALASDSVERANASARWHDLLEQAEPVYAAGSYKEALPLYEEAVRAAVAPDVVAQDRVQCLRYLADCYCRLNM